MTVRLGYPDLVHTVPCPNCDTVLRMPDSRWVPCPNPDCDTEYLVSLLGEIREKQPAAPPDAGGTR